ncbi:MAG: biotin/lipoyl-binding protein, partial [Acidobacteriota bacterium]
MSEEIPGSGDPENEAGEQLDEQYREPTETDLEPKGKNGGKRRRLMMIGAAVLVVGIIAGGVYWDYEWQFESTDDAFLDGDIVQVSPKVSAYVAKVNVRSNQFVHKCDLLVELDPSELQVRLEQARAQLDTARSRHGVAEANVHLT